MKSVHAKLEHTATEQQLAARRDLMLLFKQAPMATEDTLFNLGMYARSGVLAKFLVMADLYKRFLNVPGLLVEFGVWYGQNLVLLENLRAIYEPFAKQRKVVGFDTFTGYPSGEKWYSTGKKHIQYLAKLLKCHQRMNIYGHQAVDHELVEGDVCQTAPAYFAAHPEAVVAFAYFDIGPLKPTRAAMEAIRPHLVPGSILLLDELTWAEEPGEAIAFKEVFGQSGYRIEKCAIYPSKSIVEIL